MRFSHLDGILNRSDGLFFEGTGPSVPELKMIEGRVIHGRRLATAHSAVDPDGGLPGIGESGSGIVAEGTGNRAVFGKAAVEVELLAQIDFRFVVQIRGRRRRRSRQRPDVRYGHAVNGDRSVGRVTGRRGVGRLKYCKERRAADHSEQPGQAREHQSHPHGCLLSEFPN